MSLSSEELSKSVTMSQSSERLPKSVTTSLSSEKSIPLILSHDGKARIRPVNRGGSFNVTTAFAGTASYDYQPNHPYNQQQRRSTEPQFQENDGVDNSLGDSSSVTLSGILADGFNGSSRRSSVIVGNGINSRITEHQVPSVLSPGHYADELRRHLRGSSMSSRSGTSSSLHRRKSVQGSLRQLLEKLREDLDKHRNFVDEFVLPPISGLSLLIDLLKEIQTNRRDYRGSKTANYAHATLEESVCIQCIGKVIMHREHLSRFLDDQEATHVVSESSLTEDIDINIAAIQVLSLICDSPKGHARVIDAVSRSNNRLGQVGRLTGIVTLLTSASDSDQKATVVRFFNDLWNSAPSLVAKIFLQHELQMANFRPEYLLQDHSPSNGAEVLLRELETWRRNCIDESSLRRNSHAVEVARNIAALNHEREQLKAELKESNRKIENLESERRHLDEKCDSHRERAEELQDKVTQLRGLYRDQTGMDAEEDLRGASTVDSRLGIYGTVERNFAMQTRLRNASMGTIRSDVFIPRSTDPTLMSQSMRLKMASHIQLPLFHWTPMHAVGSTIFEDMDVEAVLRALDFSELETTFQLPSKLESWESRDRREKTAQRISKKIHFVESNRAKNLVITHRKTGLNPLELKLSIDACDVSSLPGESAHLLLNYIPTKEELQQLNVHENSYEDLGEAERILYQISRVERLNTKLAVMVFLGAYDETISNTKPSIKMLTRASESIIESERLKAVFEIILVYGNYMNCMKRGYAPGFRIDTLAKLSDVKSQDKSVTLLHHLVSVFERNFPALATFYEDLEFHNIKTVSYQAIVENIMTLRKGVELVGEESQYQPNNDAISSFYTTACEEVSELYEPFREMVNAYRVVCCLFGENYRIIEPAELFGHLIDFIAAFKKASVENFNRLNPPLSARSSDSGKKSGKGVAMTTAAATTTTTAEKRMSYSEAKSKLQKVNSPTTSGPPPRNGIAEASSTSSDDTSRKDDRKVTSRDVIVTSEKRRSDVAAKSSTAAVAERASTGSVSGKDRSRPSAVKVGRLSTSVYYSAAVRDDQRSSNSKKVSKPTKEVPAAQRDLPSPPVTHNRSSANHANHVQLTGKKSVQSTKTDARFHEYSIYESIADDKSSSPVVSAMETYANVADEIDDSRL